MKASAFLRGTIMYVILPLLAAGVVLTIAAVAPNIVQVVDIFGKQRRFSRKSFRRCFRRLEQRSYVRRRGDTGWDYVLTSKGRKLLEQQKIEEIEIQKPRQWDKRWRMVVFDIPERFKETRDALRWKLQELGFRYVNLSVWVHPYECRDQINAITEYFGVGRYVRYVYVEAFDGAEEMQRKFKIS